MQSSHLTTIMRVRLILCLFQLMAASTISCRPYRRAWDICQWLKYSQFLFKYDVYIVIIIFQISLCEDLQELLEAFFRDFKADGVEQPDKLFTGSWRLPTAAQYLGLSPQALDGSENSYVLVKLNRVKGTKAAAGNIRLDAEAFAEAAEVRSGDSDAILKFVKNYGTHYFRSVTVGDSIYQVIVFKLYLWIPKYNDL